MRQRRWAQTAWAAVLALFLAPLPLAAGAPAPACKGRDLLPDLLASDAGVRSRIEEAAASTANGQAMLWRIARPGTAPSHLFGTVHLSDDRVVDVPRPVRLALASSRRLVLEVADLSPKALGKAFGRLGDKLVFADGRSLAELLSAEELQVAETAAVRAGLPKQAFASFRPWVLSMLMAISDCERRRVGAGHLPLDMSLGAQARKRGLPVLGLETVEEQLGAMAAVPEADQLAMLRASIKFVDQSDNVLETMLRLYLAREITKVWPLQVEMWRKAGFDPTTFDTFKRELISMRNLRMQQKALPLLAKGGTFIAVGALHMVGDDGLVALFRGAGYTVTPAEQP